MKLKPLYIYAAIIIAAVVFLVISSGNDKNEMADSHAVQGNMPDDDIHKGLSDSKDPSKGNVADNIKHMMEEMNKMYEANPDDTLKAREYADFLASAHHPEKAISVYEKILQKNPKRTDINFTVAYLYFTKQDYNKSELYIDKILNYDRNNVHAKFNKGLILVSKGDKEKGRSIWKEIVDKYPDSEITQKTQEALKNLN